jgi:hypothetical protein
MKNFSYIILIIASSFLFSCKVDVDNSEKINKVEFSIKADDGDTAKTALILIYPSEAAYNEAYSKNDTNIIAGSGVIKGRAINGKFTQNLSSRKTYWIRIIHFKTSTDPMNSGTVMYSNDENDVQFGPFESKNYDNENITTKATVVLTKAYGYLVVASQDSADDTVKVFTSNNLPCPKLSNSNVLKNSSTSLEDDIPNILTSFDKSSQEYIVFIVPKGDVKIYHKSALGCSKFKTVTIKGNGEVKKELLESCETGSIIFYNSNSLMTESIKIISMPDQSNFGVFNGSTSTPPLCSAPNIGTGYFKANLPIGKYYFKALISRSETAVDSFEITKGGCITKEIKF